MPRTLQLYLLFVGLAIAGVLLLLQAGSHLPKPHLELRPAPVSAAPPELERMPAGESVGARLWENATDPLSRFFLQLFAVITVSYSVGWIFTRCGQPAVVGEMMAGVLLGPSLFGLIAPQAFQFVFAASSLEPLRLLAQVGVCLFMFAVGMEMDWGELRQKASAAIIISHTSIALPWLFGAGVAYVFYQELAQPGASFVAFALFVSSSMSITAFPVLVRILQDRGMLKTPLGRLASACAAVGDATAWGLLAVIVALARSDSISAAAFCLGFVLVFVGIMFVLVKPNLPRWLGSPALEAPRPAKSLLAIVIAIVLASALCTQLLGIRALFGSFVAGLIMPTEGGFAKNCGCGSKTSARCYCSRSSSPSPACGRRSASCTTGPIG